MKYGKPYNLLFQLSDFHGKTVVKLQKVYRKDWENCRARGGKNNFAAARALALHAHPAFGPSFSSELVFLVAFILYFRGTKTRESRLFRPFSLYF